MRKLMGWVDVFPGTGGHERREVVSAWEAFDRVVDCPGSAGPTSQEGMEMRFERMLSLGGATRLCDCGSGLPSEWERDAQGIELCRACPQCRTEKLKRYRPEILSGYDQSDVDEPIEPEECP